MSKKAPKTQAEKKEAQIVDQQKDPMLRALQKKVRNINKKLNEITQLASRKDLKPEQEQKISKKNQVVQEKEKYLQMIEIYKQIAGESEKVIRKTQLAELEDLAGIIAAKEYGVDLGFLLNQNVDNLVRVLTSPTSADLTFKQRIDEISSALTDNANNNKLKKSFKQFSQANENLQKPRPHTASNQPEPLSPRSEKEREAELKELEKEEKTEAAEEKVDYLSAIAPKIEEIVSAPIPQSIATPAPAVEEPKVQEKPVMTTTVIEEAKPATTEEVKTNEPEAVNGKKGQTRERRNYNNRGRGGDRNGRNQNNDQKPYTKKSFKPKYQGDQQQSDQARREPRRDQKRQSSSSLSSSGSQPKARQFKREEVRELIEDGFIVVGKPKVKGRDQKQYHDHQHGNKHHHHHSKRNF